MEDVVYGSSWEAHHAALAAMHYLQRDALVTTAEVLVAAEAALATSPA